MQRRNFLQLLGLGGFTAVAPVPVFGASDAPMLWAPDQQTLLTGGHTVLTRPQGGRSCPSITGQIWYGGGEIRLRGHNRKFLVVGDTWPQNGVSTLDLTLQNPTDEDPRIQVKVFIEEGQDPHLAFYKGALKMRDAIKQKGLNRLTQVPEHQRFGQGLQIVTLVDNPIFATDLWDPEGRDGFSIEVDYTQYLISGKLNTKGWETYSETGEYPIDIPTNIDFNRLLELDRQVHKGDLHIPSGKSQ